MNNEISIYITNQLEQYATQIESALIASGFTDGDDNSELVQDWTVIHPFGCALRLFVLVNESDMVAIQNAIIETIFDMTGIQLTVNFVDGCVTWFDAKVLVDADDVVDEFIASFNTERKESIRRAWDNTNEDISYSTLDQKTIAWMRQNLLDATEIAKRKAEKTWAKRGNPSNRAWQAAVIPHLEFEEHSLWLAELAHRAAPNNKEAQRWMLS